jgi:hypothetical protein
MKRYFLLVSLIVLAIAACDNDTTDNKVIAQEFRGKWELRSVEYNGTLYTLPCTISGIRINTGGYEVGATFVKFYANGIVMQHLQDLYSDGNSIFNSSGQSGVSIQIAGNNATVTIITEIDYCQKVSRFSWE